MVESTTRSGASSVPEGPAPEPSQDEMFDLLGNSRRRQALRQLLEDDEIRLTDLSARVAAQENDVTVTEVSSRQRKQVYSSLYQTHVPRLSEHGLVAYDGEDRLVRLTADADRLRRFLDVEDSRRDRFSHKWSRYFLWTAVVGSAAIAGNWLGTLPTANVTTESLYGLLMVTFMMLSVSFVMAVEGPELLRLGS